MNTEGMKYFKTEEEMDTFLEDLLPSSTVVIKEDDSKWCATWFSGKNFTKSEYYPDGISAADGEIYWYSHDKLWQQIPAF